MQAENKTKKKPAVIQDTCMCLLQIVIPGAFIYLNTGIQGWSQPLKMTATGIDCVTLPFAREILSLCLLCFSLTFSGLLFCWYFKHCSFMNMGLILLWLLYYLSKKKKKRHVVGETWNTMAVPQVFRHHCCESTWYQWGRSCRISVLESSREKCKC